MGFGIGLPTSPRLRRFVLVGGSVVVAVLALLIVLPPWNCRGDRALLSTLDWGAPACSHHGRLLQSLYPLGNRDFRLGALTHRDQAFAGAKDLAHRELMREADGAPGAPGSETALLAASLADGWEGALADGPERARRLALYAAFARLVELAHLGQRHRVEDVGAGVRLDRLGLAAPALGPVPPATKVICFVIEDVGTLEVAAILASPRLARCVAERAGLGAASRPASVAPALPVSPRGAAG